MLLFTIFACNLLQYKSPESAELICVVLCNVALIPVLLFANCCPQINLSVCTNLQTFFVSLFVLLIDIHYFHCLRIVEILKGTEASSKNIFGRYSSQRMKVRRFKLCLALSASNFYNRWFMCVMFFCQKNPKTYGYLEIEIWIMFCLSQDWQEIVSLYEADNVYLGECTLKRKESYTYQHIYFS